MQVFYYCSSCKRKNVIKTKTIDRFEFQVQINGDQIKENCTSCGTFNKRHINKVSAEPSPWVYYICIPLILMLSSLLFIFGFIATLSFSLPIWMVFNAQKKATDFNKTRVVNR